MTGNAENGFELSVERYIDAPPHPTGELTTNTSGLR